MKCPREVKERQGESPCTQSNFECAETERTTGNAIYRQQSTYTEDWTWSDRAGGALM